MIPKKQIQHFGISLPCHVLNFYKSDWFHDSKKKIQQILQIPGDVSQNIEMYPPAAAVVDHLRGSCASRASHCCDDMHQGIGVGLSTTSATIASDEDSNNENINDKDDEEDEEGDKDGDENKDDDDHDNDGLD